MLQVLVNNKHAMWADRYPALAINFGKWYLSIHFIWVAKQKHAIDFNIRLRKIEQ